MSGVPIHGLSGTPEYRAWQTMCHRCTSPTNPAWSAYGGRGITVCTRWLESVAAFVADMGAKPSADHELDRIDNARRYEPGNCRWTTRTVNSRNRRSSLIVDYRDQAYSLSDWCEKLKLEYGTVAKRLRAGWTAARAFETPIRAKAPNGSRTKQVGAHRANVGEFNPAAKLSAEDVRRLRQQPPMPHEKSRVATELGITHRTLNRILQGKRWTAAAEKVVAS